MHYRYVACLNNWTGNSWIPVLSLKTILTSSAVMAGQNDSRWWGENLRRRTLNVRKTSQQTDGYRSTRRYSDNFSVSKACSVHQFGMIRTTTFVPWMSGRNLTYWSVSPDNRANAILLSKILPDEISCLQKSLNKNAKTLSKLHTKWKKEYK